MSYRVAIVAGTLHGNRGAQAMTETVAGRLFDLDATTEIELLSYVPTDDRRLCADSRVRVASMTPIRLLIYWTPLALVFGLLNRIAGDRCKRFAPADMRRLWECDAVADVAGVSFIDGREKFLPFNVLTLLPAIALGIPVIKMPQAMGPFNGRVNRLLARVVLPRMQAIWARGEETLRNFESLALTPSPVLGDDIAFGHRATDALTDEAGPEIASVLGSLADLRSNRTATGIIGVCPSSVVAAKAQPAGSYEDDLAAAIDRLISSGHHVVLFPNATRADSGAERNNDLPTIARILDRVTAQDDDLTVVDFDVSAGSIKDVIGGCDVVATSRFHCMVGALAAAVPVVVLGWSHKYLEVMDRFGQAGRVTDYAQLSTDDLTTAIEMAFAERDEIRHELAMTLPEVRARAAAPLTQLTELVAQREHDG